MAEELGSCLAPQVRGDLHGLVSGLNDLAVELVGALREDQLDELLGRLYVGAFQVVLLDFNVLLPGVHGLARGHARRVEVSAQWLKAACVYELRDLDLSDGVGRLSVAVRDPSRDGSVLADVDSDSIFGHTMSPPTR